MNQSSSSSWKANYWSGTKNVGDLVGPWLLAKLQGPTSGTVRVCSLVGSILATADTNHWGTGVISVNQKVNLSKNNRIYAVRGPISQTRCSPANTTGPAGPHVHGDPALLCPFFYRPTNVRKTHRVGIIPHYVDKALVQQHIRGTPGVKMIDVQDSVESFVRNLLSCEMTLSSSLHGLILSTAYGIPTKWVKLSNNVQGGHCKFYDFFLSLFPGTDVSPIVAALQTDPQAKALPLTLSHLEAWDLRQQPEELKRNDLATAAAEAVSLLSMPTESVIQLLESCPFQ